MNDDDNYFFLFNEKNYTYAYKTKNITAIYVINKNIFVIWLYD